MKMNRLVAASAVLAFGLAACGGTDDTTTDPAAGESQTDAPADDVTDEPGDDAGEDGDDVAAEGDCSAHGLELDMAADGDLPEPTATTAAFLLDGALRCDEQVLATAATESGTRLTFGDADPYEFFGLPEPEDAPYYSIIARLIASTPWAVAEGDGNIHVWPSVAAGADTDADWDALVTSGLYTQEEMEQLRAAGDGYLGWRLGITDEGQWMFFVAGD